MICEKCRYKDKCAFYEEIQRISVAVEYLMPNDENYTSRIFEAINSLSKCDEFDEEFNISKKEYEELMKIKAMYKGLEQ